MPARLVPYVCVSALAVLLAMMAACRSGGQGDPAASDVATATKETEAFRAMHEDSYRRNWATIAGLHFLDPGSHTAGTANANDVVLPASAGADRVGRFVLAGDVVPFEPDPAAGVRIGDRPVTRPVALTDDASDTPDELTVGAV